MACMRWHGILATLVAAVATLVGQYFEFTAIHYGIIGRDCSGKQDERIQKDTFIMERCVLYPKAGVAEAIDRGGKY